MKKKKTKKRSGPTLASVMIEIEALRKRVQDLEARPPVVINMPKDVPYVPLPNQPRPCWPHDYPVIPREGWWCQPRIRVPRGDL